MAELTLHNLSKRYRDGTLAVNEVSLDIQDGEFMILVGPSGCGKSTLLRMIAGLEDISIGDLTIDGKRMNDVHARDRDIAMVFQNYALYPHMTVRGNMNFALRLAKLPGPEIEKRVQAAARILDLEAQLDRRPARLSGGQRQRVAMGRAIVRQPKVFLMDEPLSNLDAKLRVQTRAQLAQLQSQLNTTTVYVTHDQTEAMTLGDRVAVIQGGVIQQVDSPQRLYQQPANLFVAGFIGSPAMNFVAGVVEGDVARLPWGDVPTPQEFRGRLGTEPRAVIVGVRPEQFEDAALEPDRPGLRVSAQAAIVESMGSEHYAYVDLPDSPIGPHTVTKGPGPDGLPQPQEQIVARLSSGSKVRKGDAVELVLDMSSMLLFDPADGNRIAI